MDAEDEAALTDKVADERAAGAASTPPPLVRWTIKKPGTTPPPTSDDYTTWTVEQLRKNARVVTPRQLQDFS